MDLTFSKLHHEDQKIIANEVHKDLTNFRGKNEKAFSYLKACKINTPKMLEKKNFSVLNDATYKG